MTRALLHRALKALECIWFDYITPEESEEIDSVIKDIKQYLSETHDEDLPEIFK